MHTAVDRTRPHEVDDRLHGTHQRRQSIGTHTIRSPWRPCTGEGIHTKPETNSEVLRRAHVTYLWLSHPLDDLRRNRDRSPLRIYGRADQVRRQQVTPCPEVLTIERTKRVKSNSRRRPRAGILEKWVRSSCSRPAPGLDHTGPTATLWARSTFTCRADPPRRESSGNRR